MFYDYTAGGSWTEGTLKSNEQDFQSIKLRQRVGIDISNRSIKSNLIGEDVSIPVVLAPVGMIGMQRADGEILAAQAAEEFNVPFCLSTMSICSIEDVAKATTKPFWFQLYVVRDKQFTEDLINRAKAAKCSALVVTLDCQISSQRLRDIKNGLSVPPKLTIKNIVNMITKVRWGIGMLGTKHRTFGNIAGHVAGVNDLSTISQWTNNQFDPTFTWDDIDWIKQKWGGKLILKGILDKEDAIKAMRAGADAIVVSNHGGRQLDGAPSSIIALPAIIKAVGNGTEVWLDSGVRSGQDTLKAIALGAKGVMIGRPYVYGVGALGKQGVTKVLEIIAKELDLTMAFCGVQNIKEVTKDILYESL
jgi:L-lactate dehydrogenase (cytochrome)